MSARMLDGQVALVTGAGRGLGRAFAERLAALGCHIAVHGMREHGPSEYGGGHATLTGVAEAIAAGHGVQTLKVLADTGLVRQIHLDPERSVYDSTRTPHHHFHNLETGELRDIQPDEIAFSRFPALPEGMEAEAIEVVVRLRKKR